jgi:hypothetical protein
MRKPNRLIPVLQLALLLASPAVPAAAQSPWQSLDSFRRTGYTSGKFEGKNQDTGSYLHQITIYRLDDEGVDKIYDWYRIDMAVESTITRYRKGDAVCGWYTDNVKAAFDPTTSGGEIMELGPETTVGSGNKFINMGGSLTAAGPGIQGGYQYSQVVPDAGIRLTRVGPKEAAHWIANLQGCRNVGSPVDYRGASGVAKATYALKPSIIVRIPEGSDLRFLTKTDDIVNSFKHEKDHYEGGTLKRQSFVENFSYSVFCGSSSCSANLQ